MIIGFDASRAFMQDKTGTENYSYQLLKALAKIDKVNIYKVYARHEVKERFPDNFEFCTLNFRFLWTQVGLAMQTFKDKLDVLFVPAHTLPLIRKPGLKIVITVHDLGSKYLPQAHQIKQRLYLGLMQKYQLKGAGKIIAVSKATKVDLIKLGISPKDVTVVYEGYDKEKFSAKGGWAYGPKVNQNYFLFVGTIQPRKNLERLITAFSRQRSVFRLVIVGQRGWMSDSIYLLPKKLGIENRVKFLGYVPDENLPVLYSGAKALLFPSLFEGFGLPIIEAQACGCPVLTSNVSSMPEVAGKGAILVNPYDIDDIVRGMEKLQITGYRLQLIKAGFENVKRFSWEKCAGGTIKLW